MMSSIIRFSLLPGSSFIVGWTNRMSIAASRPSVAMLITGSGLPGRKASVAGCKARNSMLG